MNKVKLIIASIATIASMATGTVIVNAQANTNKCTVKPAAMSAWGKAFAVNGNKVTASFTVEGTNCTTPVTLAVWERPTAEGINDQIFFNHKTATFGPGRHSLTANLPNCMWQADVVEGSNPKAADGTANYQYQNGKFVDGGLRDFKKAGYGVCKKKPQQPPKETPKPPVTPEIPKTPETPVTPEAPETPVIPEAPETPVTEVTELPSTGAGSIIASTMGLSTSAGLAYNYIRSRKQLR